MSDKIIPITKDMYKNTKNMEEFYESIGITAMISEGYTFDVQKIYMNKEDVEELQSIFLKNLKKSEDYKQYTDKSLKNRIGWEWLLYSPNSSKDIKSGYIYLEDGCLIEREDC